MEKSSQPPRISPKIGIIFGILAVSAASIFIKFAQEEVSSIVISAYRLGIAALLLLPIAVIRYRKEMSCLSRKDIYLGLLSGAFLSIHFATWITSLEYTTVASSVVLVTTTPLWVAIFSPITIKEPITKLVVLGLTVAMAGVVVIGISDACASPEGLACPPSATFFAGEAFLGDFLALAGAWAAAGYVLIGRTLRTKLPLIPYIFIVYGMAALILVGMVIVSSEQTFGFSPLVYLWLVLLAVVPQLLGHSTFNWALGYLPAAFVSITLLGEPIGSTILAYFLLDEIPTPLKLFGAILILGGIIIASIKIEPEKSSDL